MAHTAKKVFYLRETVKECLTRKRGRGAGWNKYLRLCMTTTPLLQSFLSLLAPIKRGPNSNQCARREYGIAQNFYFPYCEFEAT